MGRILSDMHKVSSRESDPVDAIRRACDQLVATVTALTQQAQKPDQEPVYPKRVTRKYAPPEIVIREYSLPRYLLFEWIRDGKIRSTGLPRNPGAKRLRRLIDIDSLEQYLRSTPKAPRRANKRLRNEDLGPQRILSRSTSRKTRDRLG